MQIRRWKARSRLLGNYGTCVHSISIALRN